ncbi:MAG: hypothetical protein E7404_08955 [Ruminococcaceae bacterium]|nr:hypothetical protein [Oscillospiraceae bacterium]
MNIIPNLCENNPEFLIFNKNFDAKYFEFLDAKIIYGEKLEKLNPPVDTHIDMQLVHLGENTFVCEKSLFSYYKKVLPKGFNLLKGETSLSCNYPNDIAYNIARVGNKVIHNFKFTDNVIKNYINEHNLTMIDVSQGYAKCNVCIVDENSIITSDEGIFKKCTLYGMDVLKINPGYINLEGYDYGFIGGASVKINKNTLLFFGDISKHPDYEKIKLFLSKKGINIVCLKEGMLEDIGSVIAL